MYPIVVGQVLWRAHSIDLVRVCMRALRPNLADSLLPVVPLRKPYAVLGLSLADTPAH